MRHLCVSLVSFIGFFSLSNSLCGQSTVKLLPEDYHTSKHWKQYESKINPRVIGGKVARRRYFPWMALFLKWNGNDLEKRCGATIISENWLMTAAHCADDFLFGKVVLGETNPASIKQGYMYTVVEVIIHPLYDSEFLENDIALLKVETEIRFDEYVQPICLTSEDSNMTKPGHKAYVAGWGVYSMPKDMFSFARNSFGPVGERIEGNDENSRRGQQKDDDNNDKVEYESHEVHRELSKYLLYAKITIIDTSKCREKWFSAVDSDGETQICAGDFQKGTSKGDSGGPLLAQGRNGRWYQIGITSFGDDTSDDATLDQETNPGVYTRVAHYCQFIASTTAGEATCASSRSFQLSLYATILMMCLLCFVNPSFSLHDYCS